MKAYQKAEMIAKNLPTGSYAAGCPTHTKKDTNYCVNPNPYRMLGGCSECEVTR